MNDTMEPLVQFSPCKGKLTYLTVPGKSEKQTEYENDVSAEDGMNRTAYCYAPFSGCPDAKQTQILFILRDDASEASAQEVLTRLKICELAEQEHFLVILPNPREYGWNYDLNPSLENDMDFLIRCFAMLKGSALAVNGFNGLLFYVAVSSAASAMMASMCSLRPANVSAMLTTALPEDYRLPANAFRIETAAWCAPGILGEYLAESNGCAYTFDQILYGRNPECRLCISDRTLDAALFYEAWDTLFSRTRRWQNDTYGTYQPRTMFTQRGFIPHIQEECMGVTDYSHGQAHGVLTTKFINDALQPKNMRYILVTFLVSKPERSREVRELQLENMRSILVTFLVSKPERFREVRDLQL